MTWNNAEHVEALENIGNVMRAMFEGEPGMADNITLFEASMMSLPEAVAGPKLVELGQWFRPTRQRSFPRRSGSGRKSRAGNPAHP